MRDQIYTFNVGAKYFAISISYVFVYIFTFKMIPVLNLIKLSIRRPQPSDNYWEVQKLRKHDNSD